MADVMIVAGEWRKLPAVKQAATGTTEEVAPPDALRSSRPLALR